MLGSPVGVCDAPSLLLSPGSVVQQTAYVPYDFRRNGIICFSLWYAGAVVES